MRKIATTALLLSLSAVGTANAQLLPDDMQGSDTLNDFVQGLAADLNLTSIDPLFRYVNGGSGTGGTALRNNRQELAPMSRFLNATECGAGAAGTTGCWVVGADAIAVYGQQGQACEALAWGQTLAAQDLNGEPGVQGPASTDFTDWRTVLRILYFGQAGDTNTNDAIATRCNTDLRRTLVSQWNNLFKGGCATGNCAQGLKHAWRRDDQSGTTAVFIELLGGATGVTGAAFCNGTEVQDLDPIRVACQGNGFNGNGEQVCRTFATPNDATVGDWNLGVVLPVLEVPAAFDTTANPFTGQNCGTTSFGGAAFGDVQWTLTDVQRYGANCPNGFPPVGGTCKWPRRAGSAPGTGFGCVASANDRPAGTPNSVDARIYNLWARTSNGQMVTYVRGTSNVAANSSYFKVAQLASSTGTCGACRSGDATDQIGCFVSKFPCTLGFAGQGVDVPTGCPAVREVGLRSKAAPFVNTFARAEDRTTYPLFRDLYVCTLDNFANTGTQPAAFVNAQQAIRTALTAADPDTVRLRAQAAGFFAPADNTPLSFVGCQ